MHSHQRDFIELALAHEVLRFGSFTLKSGRVSPYFFNLGRISSGAAMLRLSRAYAAALQASGLSFDMLFGPAYKGIPLVATVACAMADAATGRDLPYAYNRKEAKDHGEGGLLVGAEPRGRVVIVDDVLTAGTALREAIGLLRNAGANPVAALVALDRQEVGPSGRSAVADLEHESGVRVIPLVTVRDVMAYLETDPARSGTLADMRDYQSRYGVH
ncbi:orotate phosphoribosyltransferase [Panacagrimonas perspica]|uniref:Orotate phosphoribosyltransferase n=1 Tax=Panacagrimonas perspica TaxID=381431 RepID=A0A4R7P0W0_9GAMM|nr:orotate phosphoribosyltransferase [Panacagrimonas perspica]TDU26701.1 orotate phosphoribosyltransferase [Panacagrimonas perspica]THD04048.1 orotate phosphoribosyltransferase [Panacagrimonas perspica]